MQSLLNTKILPKEYNCPILALRIPLKHYLNELISIILNVEKVNNLFTYHMQRNLVTKRRNCVVNKFLLFFCEYTVIILPIPGRFTLTSLWLWLQIWQHVDNISFQIVWNQTNVLKHQAFLIKRFDCEISCILSEIIRENTQTQWMTLSLFIILYR